MKEKKKKRKETCVSAQVEHFYTKFNCITTPHAIIKMIALLLFSHIFYQLNKSIAIAMTAATSLVLNHGVRTSLNFKL